MKTIISILVLTGTCVFLGLTFNFYIKNPNKVNNHEFKYSYGVFIGAEPQSNTSFDDYETIVIDAFYYSKSDIDKFKKDGHTVYTYLNIGSIEDFRDYYKEYEKYTLGDYENWPEERWIDTSVVKWQNFVINNMARALYEKGIDGFFIDNADVYYVYKRQSIYDGIKKIFEGLSKYKLPLIINGGDEWVTKAISNNDSHLIYGVNQECVFTSIDFDNNSFGKQTKDDTDYFVDYLKECEKNNIKVYLLEYTKNDNLKKTIKEFCEKNKYLYYISSTIELL